MKRTIIKDIGARHRPAKRIARNVCFRTTRLHSPVSKLWLTELLSIDLASAPTNHGTGSLVLQGLR